MVGKIKETETMCKLYLELSQFVSAKTAREIALEQAISIMREALLMNHTQNALCYGKEYTETVLWSKTESALAAADKILGGE